MGPELRKGIGGVLLLHREQVKRWSRLEAAKLAHCDSGVIRRIELGENYKVDALDRYAAVLGLNLEDLLWKVLSDVRAARQATVGTQETQRPNSTAGGTFRDKKVR